MADTPAGTSAELDLDALGRARRRRQLGRAVIYVLLALFAAVYLMPLYVMLTTSAKTLADIRQSTPLAWPDAINLSAWAKAWGSACVGVSCQGVKPYFMNSIQLVVPAVLISTALGAINGYVLTKWRLPLANLIFGMILFGAFVPYQLILLPMARTLGALGLAGTLEGLILVHVIVGIAFTTLFFRNYYISVPDELVKAARVDGAGFFRIFFRIFLPLSTPIIVVTVIWQFTQVWNDFLFGIAFTTGEDVPIQVALNNIVASTTGSTQYNVNMAAAIITALPTLLVYIFAGKYFIRGLTAGSVKG